MTAWLPGAAECAVFALAVAVLNAAPGVDFLLTVSRTLQGGARAGLAAVLGINAGCVLHALAAAFGLAALLALHPVAFRAIQMAGAAYLLWLGVGLCRQSLRVGGPAPATPAVPPTEPGRWADLRVGLLTHVLNPKVALFFLAFLPQFVPAGAPDKTASMLLLGAWFVAQSLLFSCGLVAVAARLRRLPAPTAARRWLGGLGGALFVAIGLRWLLAGAPPEPLRR